VAKYEYRSSVRNHTKYYSQKEEITTHPNVLSTTLLKEEKHRRLKRFKPTDLTTRFS
jgi:hypothetical protein